MFDLAKVRLSRGAFLIAGVTFLLFTSASGQTPETWQKVVAKNEGFTILMPKAATTSEMEQSKPSAPKMLVYAATDADLSYAVITAVVTAADWEKASLRDRFMVGFEEGVCESARAAKEKCEIKRMRDLRYKNYPAIDLSVLINDKSVATGRIVFVGERTYALMVSGYGIEKAAAPTQKFLESFEIVR